MRYRLRGATVVGLTLVMVTALAARAAPGDLDPTFGGDGKVTTRFGQLEAGASTVLVLADGRIVSAGTSRDPWGPSSFVLARYLSNGELDPTFGGDGKVRTVFPVGHDEGSIYDAALTDTGKVVAVGRIAGGRESRRRWGIARYDPDGSLDTTFSGDGRRVLSFGGDGVEARAVAIRPTGEIVVVGYRAREGGNIGVAQLTPSGALDPTFSGDGKVVTGVKVWSEPTDVAIVDGKVVVSGSAAALHRWPQFLALRYTADGALDPTFGGGDGWLTTTFGNEPDTSSKAWGLAIAPNGRLILAGVVFRRAAGAPSDVGVTRYLPDGQLDPSFSVDGKSVLDFSPTEAGEASVIQPDGKIVVVGYAEGPEGTTRQTFVRLEPGGRRDRTFGRDGLVRVDVKPRYQFESANDVAWTDGELVAVGGSYDADENAPDNIVFTAVRVFAD